MIRDATLRQKQIGVEQTNKVNKSLLPKKKKVLFFCLLTLIHVIVEEML